MLNNIKVSARLFILIGMFLVFIVALSIAGLFQLNAVSSDFSQVTENYVPSLYQISQIRGDMNRVVIYEKRHILNTDDGNLSEIEQVLSEKKGEVKKLLNEYEKQYLIDQEKESFKTVQANWESYLQIHEQVLALSREKKVDEARSLSGGDGTKQFDRLIVSVDQWANKNVQYAKAASSDAADTAQKAQVIMIVIPVISALIAFGLGLFISYSITRQISGLSSVAERITAGELDQRAEVNNSEIGALGRTFNNMADNLGQRLGAEQEQRKHLETTVEQYVAFMGQVAQGRLAQRVEVHSNGGGESDPLVVLGHNLNSMTANLQNMIAQIRDTASSLSAASAEILAATTQQASGAAEQSAAISQATTTVSEVKTIAEPSSQRSQEVTGSARRTVEVSRGGQQAMEDTIQSMGTIKERVSSIAENILSLSEQTQQIGEIIATVNEIAAQSNMLALNASVEAARAGEHGRGFSVVAAEVRTLSEQSRAATAQVKAILSEIQKATNSTVMATEEGTKGVEQGMQLAFQARTAIESLSEVIGQSAQAAEQMTAGGQQQVTGMDQVAIAMQNINQATMQSLASTRQAERAAQNLNEFATQLTKMVEQYQL